MFVKSAGIKILFVTMVHLLSISAFAEGEFYSQTVYLHKFDNPITQNKLSLTKSLQNYDLYGGLWFDTDQKTDADEAFTDAQVSPLVGMRSKVFGPDWLWSRLTLEARLVHRIKSFPDDRARTTYEFRPGILGYGIKRFSNPVFIENYYAAFYSQLYGKKLIVQGWGRQGLRFYEHFDLFNEVFVDTFDQTRDRDGTLDLRPGGRLLWQFRGGSVQLLHQFLYHFTNLEFAGRSEARSTLVVGLYW